MTLVSEPSNVAVIVAVWLVAVAMILVALYHRPPLDEQRDDEAALERRAELYAIRCAISRAEGKQDERQPERMRTNNVRPFRGMTQ